MQTAAAQRELFSALTQPCGTCGRDVFARRYFHPPLPDCSTHHEARRCGELPVARRVARQILTLPIYHDLPAESVHRMCDMVIHLATGSPG